MKLADRDGFD